MPIADLSFEGQRFTLRKQLLPFPDQCRTLGDTAISIAGDRISSTVACVFSQSFSASPVPGHNRTGAFSGPVSEKTACRSAFSSGKTVQSHFLLCPFLFPATDRYIGTGFGPLKRVVVTGAQNSDRCAGYSVGRNNHGFASLEVLVIGDNGVIGSPERAGQCNDGVFASRRYDHRSPANLPAAFIPDIGVGAFHDFFRDISQHVQVIPQFRHVDQARIDDRIEGLDARQEGQGRRLDGVGCTVNGVRAGSVKFNVTYSVGSAIHRRPGFSPSALAIECPCLGIVKCVSVGVESQGTCHIGQSGFFHRSRQIVAFGKPCPSNPAD